MSQIYSFHISDGDYIFQTILKAIVKQDLDEIKSNTEFLMFINLL